MNTATQKQSFAAWLRDRAYDTVFHVGDTALQFTADLIRGPENLRHDRYADRQLKMRERKPAPPTFKAKPKKSLSFSERQIFTHMMRRQTGESVIEHWKRRKELLAHPHKRELIRAEQKVEAEARKNHSITVERRSLAREYQQERLRKPRGRKPVR